MANPGTKQLSESSTTTSEFARPVCDEWGVYDPEQAGFEAIIRRLLPGEDHDTNRVLASSLPLSRSTSTRQP